MKGEGGYLTVMKTNGQVAPHPVATLPHPWVVPALATVLAQSTTSVTQTATLSAVPVASAAANAASTMAPTASTTHAGSTRLAADDNRLSVTPKLTKEGKEKKKRWSSPTSQAFGLRLTGG